MPTVRVCAFSISLDGFGAGPAQDLQNPIGRGGLELHAWAFATSSFQRIHGGGDGGATGVDDDFVAAGFANIGASIIGRNMFGPTRGPWAGTDWQGWWGDTPPFHTPVFVLTNHPRPSIEKRGGTIFHFVTDGIHAALDRAKAAAGARDVRIGGGVRTIQQYLHAGLIDTLHIAIAPVVLGAGERLFEGLDLRAAGYHCAQFTPSSHVTHIVLTRTMPRAGD